MPTKERLGVRSKVAATCNEMGWASVGTALARPRAYREKDCCAEADGLKLSLLYTARAYKKIAA